jgi:hypothetical protein
MTFVKQFAGAPGEIEQISVLFRLGRRVPDGGSGCRRCKREGRRCGDDGAGGNDRSQEAAASVASGKSGAFARKALFFMEVSLT